MARRLPVSKLAGSAVAPLRSKPRFRNELLQSRVTWPKDVNYLRDTYDDIAGLWGEVTDPAQDERLSTETDPKLHELLVGLKEVVAQISGMPYVQRAMQMAEHDYAIAQMLRRSGDYSTAVVYDSYVLWKLHDILETLTLYANKGKVSGAKKAYGYDVSGEVFEGSEPMANQENQKNINDTAQPQDHHETPDNPANVTRDTQAEKEFPELAKSRSEKVHWPARTR